MDERVLSLVGPVVVVAFPVRECRVEVGSLQGAWMGCVESTA
jgi:hypothetical protein